MEARSAKQGRRVVTNDHKAAASELEDFLEKRELLNMSISWDHTSVLVFHQVSN